MVITLVVAFLRKNSNLSCRLLKQIKGGVKMKNVEKWLFVLYLTVLAVLLVIAPAIYLTGFWQIKLDSVTLSFVKWQIKLGPFTLSFAKAHGCLAASILAATSLRDKASQWLGLSDTSLTIVSRKARCRHARIVALAILFSISGGAYLLGQRYNLHARFEHLGNLGLLDLLLIWLIYALAIASAITMPKAEEKQTNQSDQVDQLGQSDNHD